jgi:hypothetical protein
VSLAVPVPVRGRSMEPALADGALVEVDLEPGREPRIGEVVLVLQDRALVLHRLVARTRNGLILEGDAAPAADPVVSAGRVLGIARLAPRPLWARMRSVIHFTKAQIRRRSIRRAAGNRTGRLAGSGNLS